MHEINESRDERLHLGGHGESRELARHHTFDGGVPQTRNGRGSKLDGVEPFEVGGAYERNQTVRSFAATAIGFGKANGIVYEGAGALRGFQVRCDHDATGGAIGVNLHDRNSGGGILATLILDPFTPATCEQRITFGDFGINFDSLYVEWTTVTAGDAVNASGVVWVASVE